MFDCIMQRLIICNINSEVPKRKKQTNKINRLNNRVCTGSDSTDRNSYEEYYYSGTYAVDLLQGLVNFMYLYL